MKIYEIMHLAKQTLNLLHASCIKMDDVRYLPLFDEFLKLKADGAKTSAAVYILAQKHGLSERKIYYIIKGSSKDVRIVQHA